jgi:hypothetical protein
MVQFKRRLSRPGSMNHLSNVQRNATLQKGHSPSSRQIRFDSRDSDADVKHSRSSCATVHTVHCSQANRTKSTFASVSALLVCGRLSFLE